MHRDNFKTKFHERVRPREIPRTVSHESLGEEEETTLVNAQLLLSLGINITDGERVPIGYERKIPEEIKKEEKRTYYLI